MIVFIVINWVLLTAAIYATMLDWGDNSKAANGVNLIGCILILFFALIVTVLGNQIIQEQGVDKYLDKEITISKMEITYDSQNNPIDTVYYYARNRN